MAKLRVAVLMGGTSNEREVSLRSGTNVAQALDRNKYDVTTLDFTGSLEAILALKGQVDIVYIALHGPGGEDGRIQGLLDLLGLPYTGAGVLGSAMSMHKGMAKAMYWLAGIPTPQGITLRAFARETTHARQLKRVYDEVGLPCVVKPANEGSTIGISIVRQATDLEGALEQAFRFDSEVVVEEFIAGVEISVPVLGTQNPRPLPEIEIVPQSGFYDYEMKYTPGATQEICPARISETARHKAAQYAVRAHRTLCCKGVSRTDMIVTDDEVTVLETNSLPGMTDTSLLPLAAKTAGITFPKLVDFIIADALGMSVE